VSSVVIVGVHMHRCRIAAATKRSVCCERVFRLPSLLFVVSDINHWVSVTGHSQYRDRFRTATFRTWTATTWRRANLPRVTCGIPRFSAWLGTSVLKSA